MSSNADETLYRLSDEEIAELLGPEPGSEDKMAERDTPAQQTIHVATNTILETALTLAVRIKAAVETSTDTNNKVTTADCINQLRHLMRIVQQASQVLQQQTRAPGARRGPGRPRKPSMIPNMDPATGKLRSLPPAPTPPATTQRSPSTPSSASTPSASSTSSIPDPLTQPQKLNNNFATPPTRTTSTPHDPEIISANIPSSVSSTPPMSSTLAAPTLPEPCF